MYEPLAPGAKRMQELLSTPLDASGAAVRALQLDRLTVTGAGGC